MGAAPLKWLAKIGGDALNTTATTISAAINELVEKVNQCFQSVSDGKKSIATTLTGLGVTTASDATFATIVDNIKKIKPSSATLSNAGALSVKDVNGTAVYTQTFTNSYDAGVTATKKGDAAAGHVLDGKYFTSNTAGVNIKGTMTNRGNWTGTINPGGNVTVPAGYHAGSGKVTANANQNSATYTYPANSTGGTVDMGVNNTYRYVNAGNVYNKGKADGIAVGYAVRSGTVNATSAGALNINFGFKPKKVMVIVRFTASTVIRTSYWDGSTIYWDRSWNQKEGNNRGSYSWNGSNALTSGTLDGCSTSSTTVIYQLHSTGCYINAANNEGSISYWIVGMQ